MHSDAMTFSACAVRTLLMLGICLVLCGCPYESKVPLGPVEESVMDKELPGIWECRSDKDDPPWSLSIFRFDSRQYYMFISSPHEKPAHFRAYGTLIEGKPFLNVQELETREKTPGERFWLLSYERDRNNQLAMKIVRDELLKDVPPSSPALRDSIGRQIGDSRLYEDFCLCRRMPDNRHQ